MKKFYDTTPDLESFWRAAILFGRNVASYKFALAKSLLQFQNRKDDLVTLEELASPFAKHICEHLRHSPKQATSPSSKFLENCKRFNSGEISQEQIDQITAKLGFINVIDAFHIVNQGELPTRFFIDERKELKGIRLTENLLKLHGSAELASLTMEVESRWRLVETAWSLNISRNVVGVDYEPESDLLIATQDTRRVNVTSSKTALNGYQKGRCFYCFTNVGVSSDSADLADVDHFFPHTLKQHKIAEPIDGVWNLVLACRNCNRGEHGKFARLPSLELLERLRQRNDYLIGSHHPLRETLIMQTGKTLSERMSFLQNAHAEAKRYLIHLWQPEALNDPAF